MSISLVKKFIFLPALLDAFSPAIYYESFYCYFVSCPKKGLIASGSKTSSSDFVFPARIHFLMDVQQAFPKYPWVWYMAVILEKILAFT